MKLRITQGGWAGYTGNFGNIDFVDGLSVRDVTQIEVDRVSGLISVQSEAGEEVGPAHRLVGGATIAATVLEGLPVASDADLKAEEAKQEAVKAAEIVFYTAEELEAIAHDKGIHGLRKIAKPLGVKGRSINELVAEIQVEQGKRKAAVDALAAEAAAAEAAAAPKG